MSDHGSCHEGEPPPTANRRWFCLHAGAAAFSLGLVQTFVPMLAIRLGANNPQLGLLSALPNLLTIPALLLSSRLFTAGRKRVWIRRATLLARAGFLLLAGVPALPASMRVGALILVWALAMAGEGVAYTGIQGLVADAFGPVSRGRVLAERGRYGTLAGLSAGLLAGILLDRLPFPAGYQGIFGAAGLLVAVELWLIRRLPEPEIPVDGPGAPPEAPAAGAPVAPAERSWSGRRWQVSGAVVRFFAASALLHLTWQSLWPVFSRYQITDLGANNTWVSLLNVTNSLGAAGTYNLWARWGERWGHRRMLVAAGCILSLAPLTNVLFPSLPAVAVFNLVTGSSIAGVTLLVAALLMEVAPVESRSRILAAHQAMVAAIGTVAPLLGAWLMDALTARGALILGFFLRFGLGVGAFAALEWWETRRGVTHLGSRKAPVRL
ncbi:MAG: MFS transporter [Bacillota bacterium]|nr:MAG: hypothetical protein DIU70_08180 [Bacillota bacterium]